MTRVLGSVSRVLTEAQGCGEGCFPRIAWPLRPGNSRGPGWASPQLLRGLYWPQGLTRPSQGARPLLATATMPHSQAGPGPGPPMPQSQRQNALRGPGRLLFVQRVPRCPGKHSGEGDSGARKGGHDEDHDTASWARATLRAETTGQAQWGPHRGSAWLRPAHASMLGWSRRAVGAGFSFPHQGPASSVLGPEELDRSRGEDGHEGQHHEDNTGCPHTVALCPPLGGRLSRDHAG